VPRGIEVLIKKASVDPEFRALLLDRRADAASEIGLKLDPAERLMLAAVPSGQLETIIGQTTVPEEHRRVFLGRIAAAMLAAVGLTAVGCSGDPGPAPAGIAPDRPHDEPEQPETPEAKPDTPDEPEKPEPAIRGIRPDRVDVTKGSRPDSAAQNEEGQP
jgi:hypothetical protein